MRIVKRLDSHAPETSGPRQNSANNFLGNRKTERAIAFQVARKL
jgi:hypothetical protein